MSDDPVGVCAIVCWAVCLELIGGVCLDLASTTRSCTSRLCPWPSKSAANDEVEDADPGERDPLVPKSQTRTGEPTPHHAQPPPYPSMSQSPSDP